MPMFTQSYSELDPGQTEERLSSEDDFDYDVDFDPPPHRTTFVPLNFT